MSLLLLGKNETCGAILLVLSYCIASGGKITMNELEQLRNEILAVMWRYSKESNVTILDTIKAAHQAAERIVQITLDSKQ